MKKKLKDYILITYYNRNHEIINILEFEKNKDFNKIIAENEDSINISYYTITTGVKVDFSKLTNKLGG